MTDSGKNETNIFIEKLNGKLNGETHARTHTYHKASICVNDLNHF